MLIGIGIQKSMSNNEMKSKECALHKRFLTSISFHIFLGLSIPLGVMGINDGDYFPAIYRVCFYWPPQFCFQCKTRT